MAIDSFHAQITSAGTPVEEVVLKLGMKSFSGEISWAAVRPEQWTDVVHKGDEIRVGGDGTELNGIGPLITFQRRMGHGVSEYVTMLLPKTSQVSYAMFKPETLTSDNPTIYLGPRESAA